MRIVSFLKPIMGVILAFIMMLSPFIFMVLGAASLIYLQYLLYRGIFAESPELGDNIFCHIAAILGCIGIGVGLWLWKRPGEKFGLL